MNLQAHHVMVDIGHGIGNSYVSYTLMGVTLVITFLVFSSNIV